MSPSPLASRLVAAGLALSGALACAGAAFAGGELLPLRPGMTAVTRAPQGATQPQTLVIFDTRDPECDPMAEIGINWSAASDWNQMPNATGRMEDEWTTENLCACFGVCLDDADPPNMYVVPAPFFPSPIPADGRVSRIDGTTGAITRIADLPNEHSGTPIGLGNICHDAMHSQLHVTNFADGKIYRLDMDGTVLSRFDPFSPDDGAPGFCPIAERIWGIASRGDRVFFGTWRKDTGRQAGPDNAVFSVGLAADGGYLPLTLREEFVVAPEPGRVSMPISDIAFSTDGTMMLIAERSMSNDASNGAHGSRVLSYEETGGRWVLRPNRYSIGADMDGSFFGFNSAGGVDLDQCVSDPACTAEEPKAYATGDALIFFAGFAYGLQILPYDGGFATESYIIDLDDDLVSQDKTALGDVEVMRHRGDPVQGDPPRFEVAWVEDPAECNLGLRIAWEEAGFEPPGSGTYAVYRSTLSCDDALAQPPIASGLTQLSWYDRDTQSDEVYYYVVEAIQPSMASDCADVGPPGVTRICLDPPTRDFGLVPLPDVVWAVLRARHVGQVATYHWETCRPLLPGEHFHLLKAVLDPSNASSFGLANGEGQLGLEWTEEDSRYWLQFFDLRVANRCEEVSKDEFPPSYNLR